MDVLEEQIKAFLDIGSGYGDGYGSGYGSGSGSGYGYGDGYGSGYGSGSGDGSGSGSGSGDGIEEFDGHKLYNIDGIPTAITAVFGHYAKGFTVKYNSHEVPCYIARVGDSFAHGETLRKAMDDAMSKDMQSKTLEERIAATVKKYPDPLAQIPNSELFTLHNILTGSCEYGRRQFCQRHGISLEDSMTMEKFISLTINDYGAVAIKKLSEAYKKK